MPELPEVEVIRLGIAPYLKGQTVKGVSIRATRLRWPIPLHLAKTLREQPIQDISRRGKYLIFHFSSGWLMIHLGMSGNLRIMDSLESNPYLFDKHDHIDWHFNHCVLRYRDPRRFGAVIWHSREIGDINQHPLLNALGVEPMTSLFSGKYFYQATRRRIAAIKQILLSGKIVVGVGNIYASEALFKAKIHPQTVAQQISLKRYEKLAQAIRDILADAIHCGGSSLRDFTDSKGKAGYFQTTYFVYGRTNLPCRICNTPIQQIKQQQRSSFFCPKCQK